MDKTLLYDKERKQEDEIMYYKLIVSRLEGGRVVNVNINEGREPLQVLRQLAICYRECDKKNRKNEKIKKAQAWETYTPEGLTHQKFRIELEYDENNIYIYEYEFQGCGLE